MVFRLPLVAETTPNKYGEAKPRPLEDRLAFAQKIQNQFLNANPRFLESYDVPAFAVTDREILAITDIQPWDDVLYTPNSLGEVYVDDNFVHDKIAKGILEPIFSFTQTHIGLRERAKVMLGYESSFVTPPVSYNIVFSPQLTIDEMVAHAISVSPNLIQTFVENKNLPQFESKREYGINALTINSVDVRVHPRTLLRVRDLRNLQSGSTQYCLPVNVPNIPGSPLHLVDAVVECPASIPQFSITYNFKVLFD